MGKSGQSPVTRAGANRELDEIEPIQSDDVNACRAISVHHHAK